MMKSYDETKYNTFSLSSKAETIINESDIDDTFESICSNIISNIQKSLGKVRVGLLMQSWITLLIFQNTSS